ncbi:hypothetical protein G9U51_08260 [Calidifontibacter sp. DB0510]|uniref:Uncharacterized protein n=1 Tax=Metallococcus carri TaxID=1656884 RepID=A0A967B1I1_9MICO|nr:hypothetical protein [Metallococcus carri]NHN55768.1 hypothetical protein [Metallococcus carri]NOP38543.1 hypothetical protein [Calidifontibacter sp. DB2511S]
MALIPAYAVDGGRVPASMLRMVLWAATGGANGIVTSSDLRVSALSTPGAAVNVGPGGALLANRFSGAPASQSYAAINDATVQVSIPATGSSGGRTDYVILKIDDWHFDNSQAPADPLAALYCSLQRVGSITGLPYPFVPLAKITIPASTGAITGAMITDLRTLARPRKERVLLPNPNTAAGIETLTATTTEYFPNQGGGRRVDIPSWATRVAIRADWLQMIAPAGNCQGSLWVGWGDWTGTDFEQHTQTFAFDNVAATNASRMSVTVAEEMYIPPKYRGVQNVSFQMQGHRNSTSVLGLKADNWSGSVLDLEFKETAD